ncbi:unnamed protein product [Caenorhabditis sp. 36 PRJEB53466]|nr:unnamed protein product [Caenorhabditis sp. 36 PRJEB53466]
MEGAHVGWARSLEAVLSDRAALDAFQEWLMEYSSPQYLDLYFAIRAYERMVLEAKPEKSQLAKSIYSKFLSSRSGNCEAIPSKYRAPIGEKLRRAGDVDNRAFGHCSSFVVDFLRRQHEAFLGSDEFIDAFNKMTHAEQNAAHHNTMERRKSSSSATNTHRRSAAQTATQLTAEALLKSKHDRHTKLGETKLEKMYPPTRQPYVCNATTSHNDSAVSSSFSAGDAPSCSHRAHNTRLRHVREEQARENTGTFTVPRVEKEHRSTEGQQFEHSSEHGRKIFAIEITKKLLRHMDKVKLADEMEKHINDIQECRYTTIDMVNGTEDNYSKIDEDEELDDYLKMKNDERQRFAEGLGGALPESECREEGEHVGKLEKNTTLSPRESPREVLLHNTIRARKPSNFHSIKEFSVDLLPPKSQPRHHQIDRMSHSMIGPSGSSYSAGSSTFSRADSFAPSPMKSWSHYGVAGSSSKSSQMYDSSGIGSMAPSAFSAASSMDSREQQRRHHHRKPGVMSQSTTTPRKHRSAKASSNLITISYIGCDKVPVVAHVPNDGPMTLEEFKRHFALPAGPQQLFFKTECEDGSAPFQLLLIKDEHHLLPVFEGRIAAELR